MSVLSIDNDFATHSQVVYSALQVRLNGANRTMDGIGIADNYQQWLGENGDGLFRMVDGHQRQYIPTDADAILMYDKHTTPVEYIDLSYHYNERNISISMPLPSPPPLSKIIPHFDRSHVFLYFVAIDCFVRSHPSVDDDNSDCCPHLNHLTEQQRDAFQWISDSLFGDDITRIIFSFIRVQSGYHKAHHQIQHFSDLLACPLLSPMKTWVVFFT